MATGVTIVTGATGFAGRHLIERLEGDPVIGWCRTGGTPPDPIPGVTWQAVDIADRNSVARAIAEARPSRIYHLAGAAHAGSSWSNVVSHLQVNALGMHHLLESVRAEGRPCRLLVVSSGKIYRSGDDPISEDAPLEPSNPYALSKLAQDQLAIRAASDDGLDVVVARPFNHTGPGQSAGYAVSSFARQIARIERGLEPPVLQVGNLEARRDITDVRDVVRAYVRLMERGATGRAYNICSGRAWSIRDLLDELLHLSHTRIRVDVNPARLRPNDVPVIQGDGTRARAELDWIPTISVEQTLRDILQWWRAQTEAQQ